MVFLFLYCVIVLLNMQNQSAYAFINNFESSPYVQASNTVPSSNTMKMTSYNSDFTSLPTAANLNAETNHNSSQNELIDRLDKRRYSNDIVDIKTYAIIILNF